MEIRALLLAHVATCTDRTGPPTARSFAAVSASCLQAQSSSSLPSPFRKSLSPPPSLPSFFPAAENFPTRHRRLDSDEAREEGEEARVIPNTESDGGAIDKSSEISFLGRARTSCLGLRALPAVNSRETAPRERSLADACVSGYVAPRRAAPRRFHRVPYPRTRRGEGGHGAGGGRGAGCPLLFVSFAARLPVPPPRSASHRRGGWEAEPPARLHDAA